MNPKPIELSRTCLRSRHKIMIINMLIISIVSGEFCQAADILWNTGAGQWTNNLDWVGGVIPGMSDNADFNTATISAYDNITVNVAPANTLQAGSITVGNSVASTFKISAQSTAANPTYLSLNGVGGILLSNWSSSYQLFFTNASAAGANGPPLLEVNLASDGVIYDNNGSGTTPPADASGGEIVMYSIVTGTGNITKTGGGILYYASANTYSGTTTLTAGSLELGGAGTIGNGTGALYLEGGNLECGGSSTTRYVSNSIVVNTSGNAYIYNKSGTPGTRVFPLSGSLVGVAGTLVIGDADVTVDEYFDVQLLGSFTFNLPLVVGDNLGDGFGDNYPYDYSELQLANSTAAGTQTFNGNISGDGPIVRGSLTNVNVTGSGTTIFTGNNTYSGGTTINLGTILANNAAGSALGTGQVTVTNLGILGGNGTVNSGAAVSVYLNGSIQPGASATSVGKLSLDSGMTFYPGAKYIWQIGSVTGAPGTAWDLISCGSGWTDAGSSSSTAISINVTSQGIPTGWNSSSSYSWMIITNNGSSTGFNPSNWTVNDAGFGGAIAGVFALTTDVNGDLLLTYTPTSGNIVINVPSGTVNQGAVSPTPYPVITGLNTVTKVGNGEVIMTNSLNSYAGATYVDAGTVSAAVDSTTAGGALGASTSALLLGYTSGNSNATLNIDQPGVSVENAITIQSGSTGTKTIETTITGGQATYSGNVTLNDNATLYVAAGGSDDFEGNFSGIGGITLSGNGTNTLSGLGTYSGPTLLGSGTLNLNGSSIGTNLFTIDANSALDNTSGGSVILANNPPQVWNGNFTFNGSGNLNLGSGPVTLTTNITLSVSNNVLTVGGTIAGNGCGLTLAGPGELNLAASTNSTYTGGTTNLGGVLAIGATATFGNGNGPLVFSGAAGTTNFLLNTGTRGTFSISNPVVMNTSVRVYGNSTVGASSRVLPFTGPFAVSSGSTLYIDNTGSSTTIFNMRLFGSNGSTSYTNIDWPIVIGDPAFDGPGTTCVLDLQNDDTTPPQIVSGLISGSGQLYRSAGVLNTGGTTILMAENTFSGGANLISGAIGLGASSITNAGGVVSGPLGTGVFQLGNSSSETNLTVFAVGQPVEIDNQLYFDGDTNITFSGTNNMLFTANLNSGGAAKSIGVTSGITVTFNGAITNSGTSAGGALTKLGTGTLVFGGASTYPGTTTVNAGTLLVNGSLSTNTVTANVAGTLGGTGSISGNVVYNTGAQACLFKSAGSNDSPLTVAGNLTLNGNTVEVDLGGTTTLAAGTYTLLNYAGSLSGTINPTPVIVDGSLAAGSTATIDLSTPNQVNLIVTAPPITAAPGFPRGGFVRLPSGNYSLTATGVISAPYRLWATTNLFLRPVTNTWTLIANGTIISSPFTNYDLGSTNYSKRFYLFTSP